MGYLKDLQWYTALTYIAIILSLSFLTYYHFWHTHLVIDLTLSGMHDARSHLRITLGWNHHPHYIQYYRRLPQVKSSPSSFSIRLLEQWVKSSPLTFLTQSSYTSGEVITFIFHTTNLHIGQSHHPLHFWYNQHTHQVKSSPSSFSIRLLEQWGEVITLDLFYAVIIHIRWNHHHYFFILRTYTLGEVITPFIFDTISIHIRWNYHPRHFQYDC